MFQDKIFIGVWIILFLASVAVFIYSIVKKDKDLLTNMALIVAICATPVCVFIAGVLLYFGACAGIIYLCGQLINKITEKWE